MKTYCQKLLEAIKADMYPDEETEKCFGIEMSGQADIASLRCWKSWKEEKSGICGF
jgi:uncharacterized membrane protein